MSKKIMMIAGEASGEQHGATVVKKLKAHCPDAVFTGIGGDAMRQAGVETLVDIREMAVMGVVEVIAHLPVILGALKKVKQAIINNKPDLLILIDYAGFNLKVAKFAKVHNVPVLFYISPKIWAWKAGRIKKIKRYVDHMAVILPFEVSIYEKAGVPVTYVGSPTAESLHCNLSKAQAQTKLSLTQEQSVVALLPGSRISEITRLLPLMLDVVAKSPNKQFVLALAANLTDKDLAPYQARLQKLKVHVVKAQTETVVRAADVAICASGTATLEVALLNTPMVVVYKLSYFTFILAYFLVKVRNVSLCNIVAGKRIVEELIQYQATPMRVLTELNKILDDDNYRSNMLAEYACLQQQLKTGQSTADNVAKIAVNMMHEH